MTSSSEKARSFTQTCSMLFQRLKDNGQLGDLMQLDMQHPIGENLRQVAPMSLFPEKAGFSDRVVKKSEAETEKKAQMTIFYNGQVVVFDDFPAEKAKEVMMMASKESSKRPQVMVKGNTGKTTVFGAQFGKSVISSGAAAPVVTPSANYFPKFGGGQVVSQQQQKQQPEAIKPIAVRPIINDIPMQRKASLQRFLAKRKDRMNNLAPYQMSIDGLSSPSKPAADSKSWLGLAALQTQ